MKLLIVGFSRVGKDESAIYLSRVTGLRYGGSLSWAGLPHMSSVLRQHPMQCWTERHENRELWKRELDALRLKEGQTYLAKLALASGDIVTGMRDLAEIRAAREEQLFEKIVWVERWGIPQDATVTFSAADADDVILNDGSLDEFHSKLFVWAEGRGLLRNLLRV